MELSARDLLTLMEIVSEYGSEKVTGFIVTLLEEMEKLQDEVASLQAYQRGED